MDHRHVEAVMQGFDSLIVVGRMAAFGALPPLTAKQPSPTGPGISPNTVQLSENPGLDKLRLDLETV
jgi:hypothetical protein